MIRMKGEFFGWTANLFNAFFRCIPCVSCFFIHEHSNMLLFILNRVSLEVLEDGVTPKPPSESMDDNLPKLYVHHAAFMKVLGGTIDVDFDAKTGDLTPKLFDREGNVMDPNA